MDNETNKLGYSFYKKLYNEGWDGFKGHFFRLAQDVLEKKFTEIGMWGYYPENNKRGILTEDGSWDSRNRLNTHTKFYMYSVNEFNKHHPNELINFGNPNFHKINCEKIWKFYEENFDLYFTEKITSIHFNEINKLLISSWELGNISVISAVLSLKEIYPNYDKIEFGFKNGDIKDMNGTDIEVTLLNKEKFTIQVKSGRCNNKNYNGYFYIKGSPNDLHYTSTYYVYTDIKSEIYPTSSFIMFKNENVSKSKFDSIRVDIRTIKHNINKSMPIPEKLTEMMKLCAKNDIRFTIQKEGETNSITLSDDMVLTINFTDYNDSNFENLIDEKLNELMTKFKTNLV